MTKRETRVINAFLNCVKTGEFTEDYAVTLIEDDQRYGWLTEGAKESFYSQLEEQRIDAEQSALPAQIASDKPSFAAGASEDADEEEPVAGGETATDTENAGAEDEPDIPDDDTPEAEDALADAGDVLGAEE